MKIYANRFYMIRHIPSGLYKTAGENGNFNTTGKIWRGGTVKNHLRMFQKYRRGLLESIDDAWTSDASKNFPLNECEIIECSISEEDDQPLKDFIVEEMEGVK